MQISVDADTDILSASTRGEQDVEFLIFVDKDIDADIYF